MGIGYGRYWKMREGGPYDEGSEIFKCATMHTTNKAFERCFQFEANNIGDI
jgi:hypothetical protein